MNEFLAFSVSFLALTISIYGIFERQKAAYAALRVRFTELLEAIQELNVDELQYEEQLDETDVASKSRDQNALSGFASKRALLSYQALDLLERLSKSRYRRSNRVTASEYGFLAYSLEWCGDVQGARRLWEQAVAAETKTFVPSLVHAANLRGLGTNLMQLREVDRARECFQAAVQVEAGKTDSDRRHMFDTYIHWLNLEKSVPDGKPEIPARGAYQIASEAGPWGPELFTYLNQVAHETIYAKSAGEYREVTLDDLLQHSMKELIDG